MNSEILQKARDFENKYMHYADPERPAFHLTGAIGWINDPNGFSVYKGEYHLFFQYHPYSIEWGPMHWGHAKTRDFIHWEYLPAALAPDTEADRNGCFSGSAVEMEDGRQLLMYTGVYRERSEDGRMQEFQHQCIAVGDGVDYVKYEGNPVLDAKDLPEGASHLDFRDPKIWKEEDAYYAVVGNRPADGSGSVLLYRSEDGFAWQFVKVLDACYNEYGRMWECPDFFPLDGKQVLVVSPQEMSPLGMEFHAGYGVVGIIGDYDKHNYNFTRENIQAVDYGIDFYAPQTLEAMDGRRIMIAWMQNWTNVNCKNFGARLYGAMTLPRELSVRDGRLIQNPVREIESLRGRKVEFKNVLINNRETNLSGISGHYIDMTVSIRPTYTNSYEWFKMNLAKDGSHGVCIRYKADCSTIRIDRTKSGGRFDIVHVRDFLVTPRQGEIKLRVIMDRNSVELFVNDGEQAATFLIFSPVTADAISFEAEGTAMMNVEKYDLKV